MRPALVPPAAPDEADVVVLELLAPALPVVLELLLALPQAAIRQPRASARIVKSAPRGALRMNFQNL